jgi:histidyl-tRNA synthetase
MSRPSPMSGFPELLPAERNGELAVVESLREAFELHGFANIETRSVETLDTLLTKGEIDKEVYVLRRLQADDDGSDAGVGLHYDLTVPFARYVLENAGRLEFPFRRYQIQKAWRGERPQEGRYREFTQADIDVIDRDSLAFHHDIEVARVLASALNGLPLPPLRLRVNNRKLIEGFYRGLGADDPQEVIRVVDKLAKVSREAMHEMLAERAGLDERQREQCLALADITATDAGFVAQVRALGVESPLLDEGLSELAAVLEGCADIVTETFSVQADLSLARGLDYYTGTVFELFMTGFESLGSVGGGGRYDALASDGKTSYPGVGFSFGISRSLVPLFQRGLLTSTRSVPSAVLIALADDDARGDAEAVAVRLRGRGIATEVVGSAQKYGRQIRYAERRGIPYVWFPGSDGKPDEVKDIRSGEQVEADSAVWAPPPEDLRPRLVRKEQTA